MTQAAPDVARDLDRQHRRLAIIVHPAGRAAHGMVFAGGATWVPVDDPADPRGYPLSFPSRDAAFEALMEAKFATAQLEFILRGRRIRR